MRHPFLVLLALTAAVLAGAASIAAPAARPLTLLVSIDGFRADYLQRGVTPTLTALAANGVHAVGMRPSFPSLTFPNHYTLVTGLRPDHHGIVDNTMRDPSLPGRVFKLSSSAETTDAVWWNDAEPLWVTAEKAGIHTATMFWPGSEAAIHGVRPTYVRKFDQSLPGDARVDQLLQWIDQGAGSIGFATLYFDIVDTAGHHYGPDSAEVNAAAASVDQSLARLLAGLKARGWADKVNLVIVADHGMARVDHFIAFEDVAGPDLARTLGGGAIVGLFPTAGKTADLAKRLQNPPAHVHCAAKGDVPPALHYGAHRRIAPFVCWTDVGYALSSRDRIGKPGASKGYHGFDPASPEMAAVFIAKGPAFKAGVVLPAFDNVSVYPLLARLVGVAPLPNDGDLKDVAAGLN